MTTKTHASNPQLESLEERLGYRFQQPMLLRQALTHSSFANELQSQNGASRQESAAAAGDNEQLEFLGDSILGFITSDLLYRRFPESREGELSKLRAHLVSARHLLKVARHLELDQFLLLGRGEELSGGRHKSAILTDALEAILGAMYLDGAMEPVKKLIVDMVIEPELERMAHEQYAGDSLTDFKSALQEFLQAEGNPQPVYAVVAEEGPAHERSFTVEASAAAMQAQAQGSTKKQAAQRAAKLLLQQLQERQAGKAEDDGREPEN